MDPNAGQEDIGADPYVHQDVLDPSLEDDSLALDPLEADPYVHQDPEDDHLEDDHLEDDRLGDVLDPLEAAHLEAAQNPRTVDPLRNLLLLVSKP